jgi:predicted amidohydrolase
MAGWKLAVVQTDCLLGERAKNLDTVRTILRDAAEAGANLIAFPECVISGYGFPSRIEAEQNAEVVPGPSTAAVADDCRTHNVWCVFGLLERDGDRLYNTAVLVGPNGYVAKYRKTHLPCVGADRFTDAGNEPLAVHDLGGLKVGIGICFDGGFPEFPRVLALLGADLILLPTNWAEKALRTATLVPPVRAFENGVYFAAVNRVGVESGYRYIGYSSVHTPSGEASAMADHDREVTLFADIDPELARRKKVVHCLGEYEIDRVNWRRPDLYGPLVAGRAFLGHGQK